MSNENDERPLIRAFAQDPLDLVIADAQHKKPLREDAGNRLSPRPRPHIIEAVDRAERVRRGE